MRRLFALIPLLAFLVFAPPAEAQFWNKVKEAAKRGAERAAERETANRADRAVTGAFDKADEVVKCAVTDAECARRAEAEGQEVVYVDDAGNEVAAPASTPGNAPAGAAPAAARPGEGAWANYDFVPGDRVLFYDDFERDRVGDFPRRLEFNSGSMEIVEWEGGRALRAKTKSVFDVNLPETLPDQFTIEFDYHNSEYVNSMLFYLVDGEGKNVGGSLVQLDGYHGSGVESHRNAGAPTSIQEDRRMNEEVIPVRVAVDGSYVKVYLNEERVANVPNADFGRSRTLRFYANDVRTKPVYITNIRVAAGGRPFMYEALSETGRLALGGLLFDTGSARLRPESSPTLGDMVQMMQQNPDLRIRIEGHTDNTGDADANRRLSEERAQAVRTHLQQNGVDGSRLEAQGFGADNPVADNCTPEGRQTNRRVELVRL